MTRRNDDFTDNADGGVFYFTSTPGFGGGETYVAQDSADPAPASPIPVATPAATTPATTAPTINVTPVVVPVPTPRAAPTSLPVPVVRGSPRYQASDYADAARGLAPRGRIWNLDPDSVQGRTWSAIGKSFERSDAALNAILAGSVPGTVTPMLPEWEAALGLPDPCAGDAPTIAQRLDQVRGRFVGAGGQSRQHFIDYAAALGFTISIANYAPFRAGLSTVGNPVAGSEWSFVWAIRLIATTGALPADVLLCELQAAKPAETILILLS